MRLRVRLGLCCAEVHYGTVLRSLSLILLAITELRWKLGRKSCSKIVPQCNSTRHRPSLSQNPPKAQLPVADFLFLLQQGGSEFVAVRVGRSTLQAMNSREVLVKKWPSPLKYQYYRSLLPDVSITLCSSCNRVSFSQSFVLRAISK